MAVNVSDFVWHRLSERVIGRVYFYPGDGVGGLDVAIAHAKDNIQDVEVRHEEMAAFLACATPSSPDRSVSATPPTPSPIWLITATPNCSA